MVYDYTKLKQLRKEDLRVGMVVVGGENVTSCWRINGAIVPHTIIKIDGDVKSSNDIAVTNSLDGKTQKKKCECFDVSYNDGPEILTKLYLYQESNNVKTIMTNLKEKFVLALTKEPQKSFRKAGITNGDDVLTEDGKTVFLSWLLHKVYAEQFKKEVVDDLLADEEKE